MAGRTKALIAGAVLVALGAGGALWWRGLPSPDADFRPGKWEITIETDTPPGRGRITGPSITTQCVTSENPAPRAHLPPNCRTIDVQRDGGDVKWRVRCPVPRQGDAQGSISFRGDHVEGRLLLMIQDMNGRTPMRIRETIHGRRLGDCDPPGSAQSANFERRD